MEPVEHGTRKAYLRPTMCRCQQCKAANTDYHRDMRARRKMKVAEPPIDLTDPVLAAFVAQCRGVD